jgi:hypothetical protein
MRYSSLIMLKGSWGAAIAVAGIMAAINFAAGPEVARAAESPKQDDGSAGRAPTAQDMARLPPPPTANQLGTRRVYRDSLVEGEEDILIDEGPGNPP